MKPQDRPRISMEEWQTALQDAMRRDDAQGFTTVDAMRFWKCCRNTADARLQACWRKGILRRVGSRHEQRRNGSTYPTPVYQFIVPDKKHIEA